jgi:hypothetical protein
MAMKIVAHIHNMAFTEWIESLGKEYDYRYVTPKDVLAWTKENHSKHESLWIAEMDGEAVGYAPLSSDGSPWKERFQGASLRSHKP